MTTLDDSPPIGAALVVGGGIAGVQAALDLADNGIRVTLVEKSPAIGGRMAQLDKTFPTNDCAMCILSPKLVECARHPNIELLTHAELVGLEGEAGRFTARILRKARYAKVEECTGCGECTANCPLQFPNEFDEGLSTRKAIYRPYPQAVPNAFIIDKRGRAPCTNACPSGVSVQGYVTLIGQGRYAEALRLINERIPFAGVCGRTCNRPCEARCNRRLADQAVSICALKRFAADWVRADRAEQLAVERAPRRPGEERPAARIAIVGAGPAGLTAAQNLIRLGYQVTVFEALPVAGGMMRVGIPEYRLPRDVLQYEIDAILVQGVELRTNAPIRDPRALLDEGYDAVFLAVGSHRDDKLHVPGEDLDGVVNAITLLRQVNLWQRPHVGKRVAVVGGGITAIDAASMSLRLGAEKVYVLYRRSRDELPAYRWELEQAEAEGVQLIQLAMPTRIIGQDGRVVAVECVKTKLGPKDETGRPTPIPVEGTEFTLEVDTVVRAIGQVSDLWYMQEEPDAYLGNPQTLETKYKGIFAGSGVVPGEGFIINAIALGHHAARSIDRYLRGLPLADPAAPPVAVVDMSREEVQGLIAAGAALPQPRMQTQKRDVAERIRSFREIDLGFTEEQALAEARRCLECGICSECGECRRACQRGAIDYDDYDREEVRQVGSVILAPGYRLFDARRAEELGYGRYPNVVTSMEYERLLSASGPTGGHIIRPSDHQAPQKIAFLQCVGSRDQEHDYCSSVCCMYATKEAMLTLEHVPGVHCQVFQMDMRAFGKGFDAYYRRAQEQGIGYTRCRASRLFEDPKTKDIIIRYQDEETGEIREETYGLVVLSVGFEPPADAATLSQSLGIDLNDFGFCWRAPGRPVETSRPGVYVCGTFAEPKDIPDSVVEASGAAAGALRVIGPARGTLVTEKEYPPERDVTGEAPRIGVFICSCGSNIAGVVDVADVTAYAATLPGVVHAENLLYTCSADSLDVIQARVAEHHLNRVVVSACTPRTHEPLFQDTIRSAGLNPYLFEMANIRDQCSWVHSREPGSATQKARSLTRMAVARAHTLEPLHKEKQPLDHSALVIGGGVAGMTAALTLADQGYAVTLVERELTLGGRLRAIHYTTDGLDPQAYLQTLIEQVQANPRIEVLLGHQVVKYSGYVGNFQATVASLSDPTQRLIPHGVAIVATGGQEYRPQAYGPGVITQGDLEARLAAGDAPQRTVMIQCAGPWDDDPSVDFYCSRVCCTVAVKNALRIKELRPDAEVFVLYRDMRTYGFKEALYTEARRRGVLFVRWDDAHRPQVSLLPPKPSPPPHPPPLPHYGAGGGQGEGEGRSLVKDLPMNGGTLQVQVRELTLGQDLVIEPDAVVVSSAMVPGAGSEKLAELMKFACAKEGFFLEAHVKLRPVDFPSEGIFLAGVAHYPKFIDEAVAQAQAAAARAARILSQEMLDVGGVVAVVEPEKCTACLTCVRVCPFDVPVIDHEKVGAGGIMGAARIAAAACQGCGICVAECPAKAIQLQHYRDDQIICKTEALLVTA